MLEVFILFYLMLTVVPVRMLPPPPPPPPPSVDFHRDLYLEFSRLNIKFAISQPKMLRLPRNEMQRCRQKHSTDSIGFDLGHNIDLEFARSNI